MELSNRKCGISVATARRGTATRTLLHHRRKHTLWIMAVLVLILGAGCCTTQNVGNTVPTVASVTPLMAADGVCPNATVTATFGQAMNGSTVNSTNFTLTGPGSASVAGQVIYDASSRTATLTPSSPLSPNVQYTATIGTGAKDSFGNPLASSYIWMFTSAANGCHAPPLVATIAPAAGMTGVCPNAPITVTFNEAMNPATINATSITLTGPGTTADPGVVSYLASSNTATLVPAAPLIAGTLYTASVGTSAQDVYGNSLANSYSWSFTTAANGCHAAPLIASVTPVAGATGVCPNSPITVTFNEAMNPATINATSITLTGPGTAADPGVVTYMTSSNTATLVPATPLTAGTLYTASVGTAAQDLYGNSLASSYSWSFTTAANGCNPPPMIASVTPLAGATGVCPNSPITVTFNEAMNPATINATSITLTGPGTATDPGVVTYMTSSNTATLVPATALTAGTLYTASVGTSAQDIYGNSLASSYSWSFTIAANGCNPAPLITSVTPLNGAVGVCPNAPITVTFNEAMNPATVNALTFSLNPAVLGSISHDQANRVFTFAPSSGLALNTAYTATISTGAQDTFGNPLANSFSWTFTTAANGCNPPPTILSVNPGAGAVGVCPNKIVSATFSEAMAPLTINATTFTLTGPAAAPIAGQVSYAAGSDTAIFTPSSPLALNTTYTATITTGVQDLFGNALAAPMVWTFTTGPSSCLPPNPPIAVAPSDGSTGICTSAVVEATFGQAMNPSTINATTFTLTGPGNTPVAGQITHDSTNEIYTLSPTNPLAVSTTYTATITTGATDAYGNALANNYVWTFTTAATPCTTGPVPAVISVTPLNGATGVCANNVPTATFSEAMNPSTINTATFTLAPGVTGTVALDGSGRVATFTPSTNLSLATTYTATITTGAQDTSGNALAADYVWTFTTTAVACQPPVPLGTAANFEVLAGSTVTNNGPTTISGDNLGLSPGTSITGFPPGVVVTPAVTDDSNPVAAQAEVDLTYAYNYAAGLMGGAVLASDLTGLTITPGLYTNATAVTLSAGQVIFDAQGNANAVFILQIGTSLLISGGTQVALTGGAQAKNIFWQVGSSATLGLNSVFEGTIMALQAITLDSGATMVGRALARNAAVTLDTNTVTAP